MRLNKLLASRGIASRRACDTLIEEGAVRVNGAVVRELGTRVEPDRDRITVQGQPIPGRVALRHYLFHKPVGVITTMSDPEGRRTIRDFMPPGARLYPVGRLDADTSGLILLTNDGELAHRLMHPRYGVRKVYRVRVQGHPTAHQLQRLRDGVEFEPGVRSAPAQVRPRGTDPDRAIIEITLHEGRYRQVRRMCEAVGLTVTGLHRAGYGPLRLGDLPRGEFRPLTSEEMELLRRESARPSRVRRRGGMGPSAGRPRGPKIVVETPDRAAAPRGPRGVRRVSVAGARAGGRARIPQPEAPPRGGRAVGARGGKVAGAPLRRGRPAPGRPAARTVEESFSGYASRDRGPSRGPARGQEPTRARAGRARATDAESPRSRREIAAGGRAARAPRDGGMIPGKRRGPRGREAGFEAMRASRSRSPVGQSPERSGRGRSRPGSTGRAGRTPRVGGRARTRG